MDKIQVIHATAGHTLTGWWDDPSKEPVCEETADEVVLIKEASGRVIGFERLTYHPAGMGRGLAVETLVQGGLRRRQAPGPPVQRLACWIACEPGLQRAG